MKTFSLSVLLMLFSFLTLAQDDGTDQLGSWVVLGGTHKITERTNIVTLGILRHFEILDKLDLYFYRIGIQHYFSPKLSATLGHAYLFSENFDKEFGVTATSQHWIYEQLTFRKTYKDLSINNRYRIEHRWINKLGNTNLRHRIRYRLQLSHPINHCWYGKIFNEIIINFKEPVFNQNRLYAGLGYKFNKSLKTEIGYHKLHFTNRQYDKIRFAVYFKTDLSRKNKRPD